MREHLPLVLGIAFAAGCTSAPSGNDFTALGPSASDDASMATHPSDGAAAGPADSSPAVVDEAGTRPANVDSGKTRSGSVDASSGDGDMAPDAPAGDVETGRMVGMTAAHNAVRAMVSTQPPLAPLAWSRTLADYAQQWATNLASSPTTCAQPVHRSMSDLEAKGYGENLAVFFGTGGGEVSTAQKAVDQWSGEKACWTYGTFMGTDKCDMTCTTNLNSDGCAHYTQIAWRMTTEVGCGVATCQNGQYSTDIWICNYAPAGNFIGQAPY